MTSRDGLLCGLMVIQLCACAPEAPPKTSVFREKLLAEWQARPKTLATDLNPLCRETFVGISLHDANATLRAAGQVSDLSPSNHTAIPTPPRTTAYAGGIVLTKSYVGYATFYLVVFVDAANAPEPKISEVKCGIDSAYL